MGKKHAIVEKLQAHLRHKLNTGVYPNRASGRTGGGGFRNEDVMKNLSAVVGRINEFVVNRTISRDLSICKTRISIQTIPIFKKRRPESGRLF